MVDILVSRPGGGLDVTRRNPRTTLYVTTDPTQDPDDLDGNVPGSIRFVKRTTQGNTFARIELKSGEGMNAVWNKTGMQFSANSVELGNNLVLEGAAHFLKTENSEGTDDHATALIPHIDFNDDGAGFAHSPVLDAIEEFVFYDNPVPANEAIGTVIGQFYPITFAQIIDRIVYRAGTVSATAPVQHNIYQGSDNSGLLINQVNLPANFFFAQESIINVTNASGKARFNFTPGPTLTIGQTISNIGYLFEVEYNTVDFVSNTGAGFFELQNVLFQGDDSGGLFSGAVVELGSNFGFSSEQVDIFIELTSTANFSLQRNGAVSPNVLTSFKTQRLKKIELVMAEQLFTTEGDAIVDNNFDYVIPKRFP